MNDEDNADEEEGEEGMLDPVFVRGVELTKADLQFVLICAALLGIFLLIFVLLFALALLGCLF